MMVEIACLYTSCECPSRRSNTQKLSNQVTTPCSFTPFTRKIVSGVLFFRTWLRNVSCRFCERSAAIVVVPFYCSRAPSRETYCQVAVPICTRKRSTGPGPHHYKPRPRAAQAQVGGTRRATRPSVRLGIAVKFRAQCGCNQPGCPIADRTLVNANNRHDDLAGRGQEGLAGAIGFLHGKGALLKLQALGSDHVDQHGPCNAPQNSIIRRPCHNLSLPRDDPRITRRALGDVSVAIDEPRLFSSLLTRRLFRQNVGQQRNRFDVDAPPTVIGHGDDGHSFGRDSLVRKGVEAVRGDHDAGASASLRETVVAARHAAGDL